MTASPDQFDVVVVGGGIAGVSAAYHLADTHRVAVVEAERQLAHHSTGRSAALLFENYGAGPIRPLTVASRSFFADPPEGLAEVPLVTRRGAMWVGTAGQEEALARLAEGGRALDSPVAELTAEEARRRVPVLSAEWLAGAVWEPDPLDLDVAAIHQAFVRGLRSRGGSILTSAPVQGLARSGRRWRLVTPIATLSALVVIDAAGAWGDLVAALAGLQPVGLVPLRRTAFMVAGDPAWAEWPMVVDADHRFYFKPDGPQLLCSPADETPTEPGDARPDPLDVALAIDRINAATTLGIRSVRSEWAGLRTFAPDRSMVIGPDPDEPSFVWAVGQGGTGIQTSPAAGALVAAQVRGEPLPAPLAEAGVDPDLLAPDRLRG